MFVVESPSDVSDDIICTRRTRPANVVCPNQLQRTIERVPKVANGDRSPDTELDVANLVSKNTEKEGTPYVIPSDKELLHDGKEDTEPDRQNEASYDVQLFCSKTS